jgi:hypothetical protein
VDATRDRMTHMLRPLACVTLLVTLIVTTVAIAQPARPSISIRPDGALVIQGSAEVPRYAVDGHWTEVQGRSTMRYVTRHFLFDVPNEPPAMELFVSRDLKDEPPDGVFEVGLVRGFLSAFGGRAGFRYETPRLREMTVGSIRVTWCRVELSKEGQTLWLYAYVFPRQPSLTFLTVRPRADGNRDIEEYLKGVQLR